MGNQSIFRLLWNHEVHQNPEQYDENTMPLNVSLKLLLKEFEI